MKLAQLIADLPDAQVLGSAEVEITAITYDSRTVAPGSLFVAIQGTHVDGHRFIGQALAQGAAAIVCQEQGTIDQAATATFVRVPNSRAALSPIAAAFYGYPGRSLRVVGVTGSKGKTTTSTLIAHVLDAENHTSGLMTTVDFKIGPRWWSNLTRQTTPEALEVQQMLREMLDAGCDFAVVEASSHGLSPQWNRVGDCDFDVAVLTNLTHEHLDYHGTIEQYRRDKARLFELLHADGSAGNGRKTAVINLDDPNAEFFIQAAGSADVITYALHHPSAMVRPYDLELSRDGVRYTATTPWGDVEIELGIPGEFNVLNSLAALSVGLSQGISGQAIAAALRAVGGVNGRMERVELGQPFTVVVDYAHNPDSFEQVMGMLRPLTSGKLISVFGSAGERDHEKRAIQGEIAGRYCDLVVIADEDPRDEDPQTILAEIAEGVRQAGKREGQDYLLIADRAKAIREAFSRAQPGDIVLLLGKGHESCIIYEGGRKLPWSERGEAEQALREMGYGEQRAAEQRTKKN